MSTIEAPKTGPTHGPADQPSSAGAFAFPIFLDVRGRRVFVARGSHESDAKAEALADLGADVSAYRASDGPFHPALLDGASLAVVGTGDRTLDHRIAAACRDRGILVNTVDDIPWCDWSAPAILRRGDLTLALGTAGIAPALAVRLRDLIGKELVGPEYQTLLELFAEARPVITASGLSFRERRRLWYRLVDGPAIRLVREDRIEDARTLIATEIDAEIAARRESAA